MCVYISHYICSDNLNLSSPAASPLCWAFSQVFRGLSVTWWLSLQSPLIHCYPLNLVRVLIYLLLWYKHKVWRNKVLWKLPWLPSTLALKCTVSFPAHVIITKENENLGKKIFLIPWQVHHFPLKIEKLLQKVRKHLNYRSAQAWGCVTAPGKGQSSAALSTFSRAEGHSQPLPHHPPGTVMSGREECKKISLQRQFRC